MTLPLLIFPIFVLQNHSNPIPDNCSCTACFGKNAETPNVLKSAKYLENFLISTYTIMKIDIWRSFQGRFHVNVFKIFHTPIMNYKNTVGDLF